MRIWPTGLRSAPRRVDRPRCRREPRARSPLLFSSVEKCRRRLATSDGCEICRMASIRLVSFDATPMARCFLSRLRSQLGRYLGGLLARWLRGSAATSAPSAPSAPTAPSSAPSAPPRRPRSPRRRRGIRGVRGIRDFRDVRGARAVRAISAVRADRAVRAPFRAVRADDQAPSPELFVNYLNKKNARARRAGQRPHRNGKWPPGTFLKCQIQAFQDHHRSRCGKARFVFG